MSRSGGGLHMHGHDDVQTRPPPDWRGPFLADNGRARTEPAIDAGGTFELHMSPRAAIRLDVGRTIIPFGSAPVRSGLPPYSRVLGTSVNPQASIGSQFRF